MRPIPIATQTAQQQAYYILTISIPPAEKLALQGRRLYNHPYESGISPLSLAID